MIFKMAKVDKLSGVIMPSQLLNEIKEFFGQPDDSFYANVTKLTNKAAKLNGASVGADDLVPNLMKIISDKFSISSATISEIEKSQEILTKFLDHIRYNTVLLRPDTNVGNMGDSNPNPIISIITPSGFFQLDQKLKIQTQIATPDELEQVDLGNYLKKAASAVNYIEVYISLNGGYETDSMTILEKDKLNKLIVDKRGQFILVEQDRYLYSTFIGAAVACFTERIEAIKIERLIKQCEIYKMGLETQDTNAHQIVDKMLEILSSPNKDDNQDQDKNKYKETLDKFNEYISKDENIKILNRADTIFGQFLKIIRTIFYPVTKPWVSKWDKAQYSVIQQEREEQIFIKNLPDINKILNKQKELIKQPSTGYTTLEPQVEIDKLLEIINSESTSQDKITSIRSALNKPRFLNKELESVKTKILDLLPPIPPLTSFQKFKQLYNQMVKPTATPTQVEEDDDDERNSLSRDGFNH